MSKKVASHTSSIGTSSLSRLSTASPHWRRWSMRVATPPGRTGSRTQTASTRVPRLLRCPPARLRASSSSSRRPVPPTGSATTSRATPRTAARRRATDTGSIKEGTGKPGLSGPDTFPPLNQPLSVTTNLLGGTPDLTKARGFVLDACATGTSLETSTSVPVGPTNKVHTEICACCRVPNQVLHPGLIVQIDETSTAPLPPGLASRITEAALICMPAPPSVTPPNPGVSFVAGLLQSELPALGVRGQGDLQVHDRHQLAYRRREDRRYSAQRRDPARL